ncbi:site-specific DNA-adenine methylase [Cereibacter ovatus]|uniref:site-specific DNA-methyltransferase (adenine-specific) n=1 Tax=Cereibacter ovatus TaxID=439529 RepID=A0A285CY59_9RHOB|nr:DNA adenine methylase [Cereibacter ovatus]SNX71863.1 site-specific DNA-adenine methylase [Cereibacter ovatus]
MDKPLTAVTPVQPVAPWLGGKRNLAKRICGLIDRTPCLTYAEPFVGMGGIFLRRATRPRAEVINDRGRDVANLFRILQRHYPQFLDTLRFQLTTRAEFNRLVATDPDTLTDLERAARFLYLQRTAFGGKVSGRNFGVSSHRPGRFNLSTLEPMLEDLHSRLAGVIIECLDWAEFIPRYDRDGTLFYLDPPYWGCEGDYGRRLFQRGDFERMAELLAGIEGRFILSLNDVPEVRAIFARFHLTEVTTSYTIGDRADRSSTRAELLISNRDLPPPG